MRDSRRIHYKGKSKGARCRDVFFEYQGASWRPETKRSNLCQKVSGKTAGIITLPLWKSLAAKIPQIETHDMID